MSYPHPKFGIVIPFLLCLLTHSLFAAEPEENTIPILAIRAASGADFSKVSLPLLCELTWKHFDGVDVGGPVLVGSAGEDWDGNREFMEYCGRAGLLLSLAPWELCQCYNPWNVNTAHWFRWTEQDLDSDSCFGQLNFDMDALVAVMSAEDMADTSVVSFPGQYGARRGRHHGRLSRSLVLQCLRRGWGLAEKKDACPGCILEPLHSEHVHAGLGFVVRHAYACRSGSFGHLLVDEVAGREQHGSSGPAHLNLVLIHSIGEDEYSDWGGNSQCDFCHGTLEQHADMVSAVCGTMYQGPPGWRHSSSAGGQLSRVHQLRRLPLQVR